MKLLLDAAGRLAPNLPDQQRQELDLARRKLLETSRSFSNALKSYFKDSKQVEDLLFIWFNPLNFISISEPLQFYQQQQPQCTELMKLFKLQNPNKTLQLHQNNLSYHSFLTRKRLMTSVSAVTEVMLKIKYIKFQSTDRDSWD